MYTNRYQSFLRVSLLVTAVVLVFDGGSLSPVTKQLSDNTITYLGAVGSSVVASVPQNEINSLSTQLSEQQRVLDAREAALREREIAARTYETDGETDYSTYILSTILFILTVLIVMNYVMDWARVRRFTYEKQLG